MRLTIHWEQQTADEIEYLINAGNPKYGGAICYYQNALIKIMEAAPVATQPLIGKKPGEIVHAHPHEGLFINCKHGKLLKINCISSDAGILSGTKYVQMGVLQGQLFTTLPNQKTKNTAIKNTIGTTGLRIDHAERLRKFIYIAYPLFQDVFIINSILLLYYGVHCHPLAQEAASA